MKDPWYTPISRSFQNATSERDTARAHTRSSSMVPRNDTVFKFSPSLATNSLGVSFASPYASCAWFTAPVTGLFSPCTKCPTTCASMYSVTVVVNSTANEHTARLGTYCPSTSTHVVGPSSS